MNSLSGQVCTWTEQPAGSGTAAAASHPKTIKVGDVESQQDGELDSLRFGENVVTWLPWPWEAR